MPQEILTMTCQVAGQFGAGHDLKLEGRILPLDRARRAKPCRKAATRCARSVGDPPCKMPTTETVFSQSFGADSLSEIRKTPRVGGRRTEGLVCNTTVPGGAMLTLLIPLDLVSRLAREMAAAVAAPHSIAAR